MSAAGTAATANEAETCPVLNRCGLSALQRGILALALANREAGGGAYVRSDDGRQCGADVQTRTVLEVVYGWRPVRRVKHEYGAQAFDIRQPGYGAARAAVSRAFARLEARGLVVRMVGTHWAGVNLTADGEDVARELRSEALGGAA